MRSTLLALLSLAAGALVSPQAVAQKGPASATEFKGVVLGAPAPLDRLADDWLLRCRALFAGGKRCTGYTSVSEVQASVVVEVSEGGTVEEIQLFFKAESYAEVRRALDQKYGKPNSLRKSQVQVRSNGAVFPNETAAWTRRDGARVGITWRSGDSLDESLLMFQSPAAAKASTAEFQKKEADRRSDL